MAVVQEQAPRDVAVARQMLAFWDRSWTRNLAASFLAFVWFGVGGYSILPVGLLIALALMLPDVPGWSLWRRLVFAGRRTLTLVALSMAAFFFAHVQIGAAHPDGRMFHAGPRFLLPTAMGWVKPESEDTVESHRFACARGSAESCAALGRAHLYGEGAADDPTAAAGYFERACDSGHALSCVSLGRQYSRGTGVTRDRARAKQLYAEACDAGQLVGCHNQGALQLAEGHHLSGMRTLMRACTRGFARSCFLVGEQFRLGNTKQPKAPQRAEAWLGRACREGVTEACQRVATSSPVRRSERGAR